MGVVTGLALPVPASASAAGSGSAAATSGIALPILLTVLFGSAVAIVGLSHEPWFDEAQAWLLARDNALPELLADRVRYEGSPGLWHVLLWTLIRAGLPYSALWTVPATLAVCGAFLVLRHGPFPLWVRIGLVLSYPFAYQYAAVARSYALDLVLFPALAIGFGSRTRHPGRYGLILGLMANANAHGFLVAAVLGLELAWQALRLAAIGDRRVVWGAAVAAAFGLLALAQTFPPPADGTFLADRSMSIDRMLGLIGEALIERGRLVGWDHPTELDLTAGALLSALALVPGALLARRAGRLWPFAGAVAALAGFATLGFGSAWHSGILFLVWMAGLWVSWPARETASPKLKGALTVSLALVLAANAAASAASWWREIAEPYSAGRSAAAWLKAERPARVAALGFKALSVQPYFDRNIVANRGGPEAPAYLEWRSRDAYPVMADARSLTVLLERDRFDAILVSAFGLEPPGRERLDATAQAHGYCRAARFDGRLIWKGYWREDDDIDIWTRCRPSAAR